MKFKECFSLNTLNRTFSQIGLKEVSDLMMLLNELQEKLLGTELRIMSHTGAIGMTYKCI